MSVESFTCLLVFKNIFSFALTFKGFDWIVQSKSIKTVFVAVGCVQIAVCCLSIPMCKSPVPNSITDASLTTHRRLRQKEQKFLPPTQRILQSFRLGSESLDVLVNVDGHTIFVQFIRSSCGIAVPR
jgi:hypothetical protein